MTAPSSLEQLSARMADGTPQARALGLRFVSVEPGVAMMAVPWREDLVGEIDSGVIAGGVITSLLDHVCGMACSSLAFLGETQPRSLATLDLRIDYMRPAIPRREVFARARCYKLTRSIGFVRAAAFEADEEDPVATAQAAFALGNLPPVARS
ncbi:MAG TPA: PaaI family thioesterase [Caulobacteraceae bacterium]|jgi:uncharacterized protein (TIGR00369 family)|nr:PaaI family thioesterase [Caulobacteraceae bacterium]